MANESKELSKAKLLRRKKDSMQENRQSYEDHWRDIADYVCPRQYRWLTTDWNTRGNKANRKIIDPTGTLSNRALAAAFSSSITSPSRPWKRLANSSGKFRGNYRVSTYLADCDEILDEIILKSNFYQETTKLYEQMASFGTAAMLIEEDPETVIRCETFATGSYWLGQNAKRQIDQFARQFVMTPAQMVSEFGEDNVCDQIKEYAKDPVRMDSIKRDVFHYIGPGDDYEDGAPDPSRKKFQSCYIDLGASDDDKPLRESGYDEFPIVAPRWKSYGDDIYGFDCPGMIALGHIKQLQHAHTQMMKAIEKQVNPPLQAPEGTRRRTVESIPGSINTVERGAAADGIRPLYQVTFDLNGTNAMIVDLRDQVKETFFYNLFLMVANERRSGTKAREIEELHEEKMLMLSSVYEQVSQEFLDPSVTRIYGIANRMGRLPTPPPEFAGQQFTIEYVSVMANAMKLIGIGNMDRAIAVLGQIGTVRPEVLDLVNFDRFAASYMERLGIDPRTRNSPEEIGNIRNARAQQMAKQEALATQQIQADTAKVLSDTKIAPDTALQNLINQARPG